MDRIFYGLKRAYHSTLRISRRDFKEIGNTPARMDILHALYNRGRRWTPPIWQSLLRRIIGYTARSTISELLRELEDRLWVRRKRSKQDKRQVEVELTEKGRRALEAAYSRFDGGWPLHALSWAKDWREPVVDELEAWRAFIGKMGRLETILLNVRFALRDTGCVHYSWFTG
jgi:DNA-binding MarR family transcriptional regulator